MSTLVKVYYMRWWKLALVALAAIAVASVVSRGQ